MSDIEILYHNEIFCKIKCEKSIAYELQEQFSFFIDNHRFHPKVKNKSWDGKIKLLNLKTMCIYVGLINQIIDFAKNYEYSITCDKKYKINEYSFESALEYLNSIPNLPFTPRDYQEKYYHHAIQNKRSILVSPTGSGKSFIMYLISKKLFDKKILIIVPTITLVYQLVSDFKNYGYQEYIHTICEGNERDVESDITIATWQSLQYMATDKKLPKRKSQYNPEFFHKFDVLLGDECHTFAADALKNISECLINCDYRIGLTGTLSESKTNTMVLTGLFGDSIQFKTSRELIDEGTLSEFKIKCISLEYPNEFKKLWHKKKISYQEEIAFYANNEKRNSFISKLAISLTGNTIVMFRYHDQGKALLELIKKLTTRNVYYYSGEESGEERERLREIIENDTDCIIIGSIQAISTGINIVQLHNIIFASPSKSRIKVIQSIGRILRKSTISSTLYDISDDIRYGQKKNYAYLHFIERLKMYVDQKFKYSLKEYNLM